jgi:hypothetical protein
MAEKPCIEPQEPTPDIKAMRSVDIATEFLSLHAQIQNPKASFGIDELKRCDALENELNNRGFEVSTENDENVVKIQQSFNQEPDWCRSCKKPLDVVRFEETLTAKFEKDKGYTAIRRTCKAFCPNCGVVVGEVDTDPEQGYQKGLELSYNPQEE